MIRTVGKSAAILTAGALLLSGCGGTGAASGVSSAQSSETAGTEAADTTVTATADASSTSSDSAAAVSVSSLSSGTVSTNLSQVDMTKWQYNGDDDVWYQLNIQYAENSPDEKYDTLAIFVPGAYMDGTDNGDGTYTCQLNTESKVGNYTSETAPIVVPVNTPGYSAQEELTEYTDVSEYTDAGFIYVHIGCRGRDAGAPYGVTDLKAGIRYIRYNSGVIAGNTDAIFSFGMSGGGAQSALLGATGDSSLYDAYLEEVGAVTGVSDAVLGSMDWCPITSLDSADEAYEWNMGSTRSGLSDEEQEISDALAEAYASYINSIGLTDEDGNVLTLEASDEGIYQAGTYYDYIKNVIETSLENFIADTKWPYDASAASAAGPGGGQGGPNGGKFDGGGEAPGDGQTIPDGQTPPDGGQGPAGNGQTAPDGGQAATDSTSADQSQDASDKADGGTEQSVTDNMAASEQNDNITRNAATSSLDLSGTYETPQDYIDALNADGDWVSYDASTGEVTITSVEAFTKALKNASKNLGAFDQLDADQGENTLFGYGDGEGAHFDATLASILEKLGSSYADAYAEDLTRTDSVGNTVDVRLEMYSPLYYLLESQDGYNTSNVAKYWRIRTGINQGDTALSTEVNLALAAEANPNVESVDFATVWGQGHTMAERTGDADTNFIDWVNDCMSQTLSEAE